MMSWEGCEGKRSWPNFKVVSQNLPWTEKNHKSALSGQSDCGLRFEPGTSRIRCWNVNFTTKFGQVVSAYK
jgi:hypothetical protein